MHDRDHLDGIGFDPIDHIVREAIYAGPSYAFQDSRGRFGMAAEAINDVSDLRKEVAPKSVPSLLVKSEGELKFLLGLGEELNRFHPRAASALAKTSSAGIRRALPSSIARHRRSISSFQS